MGTHPNGLKTFDWDRTDCDIWMFNEAPSYKKGKNKLLFPKCDACFQLHHEAIWKNPKNISVEGYPKWLSSGKTPVTYMQEKYKDVPNSIKYPIEKIYALSKNTKMVIDGRTRQVKCFSSSPDFAFAMVAHMWKQGKRYQKVEVHGIEMETGSEYYFQRTGFAFWIGYLTALGINLTLYNSIFDSPIYGYEGDVLIPSFIFEKRISKLTKKLGNKRDEYNQEAKEFMDGLSLLSKKDTSKIIRENFNKMTKLGEEAGIINGQIKQNQKYLEMAKAMEEVSQSSVFAAGQFDSSRTAYNKQYFDVRKEAVSLTMQTEGLLKKIITFKKDSPKREKMLEEYKITMADLLNKNMLLFHVIGALKESQYYLDSVKQSYFAATQS